MLTKAQIKYIRSLSQRKFRYEYNVFVAEGDKIVREWLQSNWRIETIVGTEEWLNEHNHILRNHSEAKVCFVDAKLMESISALNTPQSVLIVAEMPVITEKDLSTDWFIILDDIQDPGNMGTIIRIADWFGIPSIVVSPGCVDVYNPKVIQAGMGSHTRVAVFEKELVPFLATISTPIIAATLDGENIYTLEKLQKAALIIGNEGRGVSEELLAIANRTVTIPRIGKAESLNAGVSAGILCALLRQC